MTPISVLISPSTGCQIHAALDNNQKMNTLTNGNICMMQHIDNSAHVGEAVETRDIQPSELVSPSWRSAPAAPHLMEA